MDSEETKESRSSFPAKKQAYIWENAAADGGINADVVIGRLVSIWSTRNGTGTDLEAATIDFLSWVDKQQRSYGFMLQLTLSKFKSETFKDGMNTFTKTFTILLSQTFCGCRSQKRLFLLDLNYKFNSVYFIVRVRKFVLYFA